MPIQYRISITTATSSTPPPLHMRKIRNISGQEMALEMFNLLARDMLENYNLLMRCHKGNL